MGFYMKNTNYFKDRSMFLMWCCFFQFDIKSTSEMMFEIKDRAV